MSTPENEQTWLENHLDKWIGSLRGLPKTIRKPKYFIMIISLALLFSLQWLLNKPEIARVIFSVEKPPQQPEPGPDNPPLSPKEIIIQYKKNCGETSFNIQLLQSKTTAVIQNLRFPVMVQLSGALSHQVTEGNGSAAFVVAKFTICTGNSVVACPEPKLDCSIRCKYSRADSFTDNTSIATDELAGILANSINDAQHLNSLITEGNLCKTRWCFRFWQYYFRWQSQLKKKTRSTIPASFNTHFQRLRYRQSRVENPIPRFRQQPDLR